MTILGCSANLASSTDWEYLIGVDVYTVADCHVGSNPRQRDAESMWPLRCPSRVECGDLALFHGFPAARARGSDANPAPHTLVLYSSIVGLSLNETPPIFFPVTKMARNKKTPSCILTKEEWFSVVDLSGCMAEWGNGGGRNWYLVLAVVFNDPQLLLFVLLARLYGLWGVHVCLCGVAIWGLFPVAAKPARSRGGHHV